MTNELDNIYNSQINKKEHLISWWDSFHPLGGKARKKEIKQLYYKIFQKKIKDNLKKV